MITKSLIAAAAVAVSLTALAPVQQAQAKVNVDINLGLGGGYYPGYGGGYDYGYDGGYYPVVEPYYDSGISCNRGKNIVRRSGFRNVHAIDCGAPVYQYKAWKFGSPYKVRVNIHGDIIKVKPWY